MFSLNGTIFSGGATLGMGASDWFGGDDGNTDNNLKSGTATSCPQGQKLIDGWCVDVVDQQQVNVILEKAEKANCPVGKYWDPFTGKCETNPETKGMATSCPAGETIKDGHCYKVNSTGTPVKTTPPAPVPVGEDSVDWVPLAAIGALLAAGGYLVWKKKQKKAGLSRNWHEAYAYLGDDHGYFLRRPRVARHRVRHRALPGWFAS